LKIPIVASNLLGSSNYQALKPISHAVCILRLRKMTANFHQVTKAST